MGGLMSRNKGARAERQIIDVLQPVVNEVYAAHDLQAERPLLKRNASQADGGGEDISAFRWLAIEVKHQECDNVNVWWRQACAQAEARGAGCVPVLIYRRNHQPWRVMLPVTIDGVSGVGIIDMTTFLKWFRARLNQQLSLEYGWQPPT